MLERDRIFISTIFSHRRFEDFRRILNDVAAEHGRETVYVQSNIRPIARNVHELIESCRYFLQIVTPRDEDQVHLRESRDYIPDFTWVTHEYGCAVALALGDQRRRCVRMVDKLIPNAGRERLKRTQGDTAPISFRLDDSEADLRRHLTQAVGELLDEI